MDAGDNVGARQGEDVVVAAQVVAVTGEALAAKTALIEPVLLDHRAHGAIEQHDALGGQALQALDARAPLGLIAGLDGEWRGEGLRRAVCLPLLAIGTRRREAARAVPAVRAVRTAAHAGTRLRAAGAGAHGAGRNPSAWQIA